MHAERFKMLQKIGFYVCAQAADIIRWSILTGRADR